MRWLAMGFAPGPLTGPGRMTRSRSRRRAPVSGEGSGCQAPGPDLLSCAIVRWLTRTPGRAS